MNPEVADEQRLVQGSGRDVGKRPGTLECVPSRRPDPFDEGSNALGERDRQRLVTAHERGLAAEVGVAVLGAPVKHPNLGEELRLNSSSASSASAATNARRCVRYSAA